MATVERDNSDLVPDWIFVREERHEAICGAQPVDSIIRELHGDMVCIAAQRPTAGMQYILSKADDDLREYVLLSEGDRLQHVLAANRLVRLIPQQQNGAVLICGDRSLGEFDAWVFADDLMRYGYRVPDEQVPHLYLAFAKLFWTRAEKEYLGGRGPFDPRSLPGASEFSRAESICLGGLGDFLEFSRVDDAYLGEPSDATQIPEISEGGLLCYVAGALEGPLPRTAGRMAISVSDNAGFSFVSTETCGVVLPRRFTCDGINWACRVSDIEGVRFREGYACDWVFPCRRTIGDLVGSQVRTVGNPSVTVKVTENGSGRAFIQSEDMAVFNEALVPSDLGSIRFENSLSCHTVYTLEHLAPLVPEQAVPAHENAMWDEAERHWKAVLQRVKEDFGRNIDLVMPDLNGDEVRNLLDGRDMWCRKVDDLRARSTDLRHLGIARRRGLYSEYKNLHRESNYFFRQTNQFRTIIRLRRMKTDAIKRDRNYTPQMFHRGAIYAARMIIDKVQDFCSHINDVRGLEKVSFPKPLPVRGTCAPSLEHTIWHFPLTPPVSGSPTRRS